MSDLKQPEAKPTVPLAVLSDRALLEELARNVKRLERNVESVSEEGKNVNLRMAELVGRVTSIESRDTHPPFTSERVRGIVDSELQTKLAAEIVKDQERDRKIAETHALASSAATKADVQAVDRKIDTAAIAQTQAIIAGVTAVAKNPMVQRIAWAVGALALQALALATAYLAMKGPT